MVIAPWYITGYSSYGGAIITSYGRVLESYDRVLTTYRWAINQLQLGHTQLWQLGFTGFTCRTSTTNVLITEDVSSFEMSL